MRWTTGTTRWRAALATALALLLVPAGAGAQESDDGLPGFGGGDDREPVGTAPPLPRVARSTVEDGVAELVLHPAPSQRGLPDRAFTLLVQQEPGAPEEERDASIERLQRNDIEVVLAVDPMAGRALPSLQGALVELVRRLPDGSRVGVVSAGESPRVLTEPVTDDSRVLDAIGALSAGDERDPYGAVALALEQFQPGRNPGRFLVFVSAGGYPVDQRSEELTDRVDASGIDTYLVQLDRAFLGVVTPRYPLPLGSGRILVQGAGTVPTAITDEIVDEILGQRIVRFSLRPGETSLVPTVRIDAPSGPVDVVTLLSAPGDRGSDFGLPDEAPEPVPRKALGLVALGCALLAALVLLPPWWRRRRTERRPQPQQPPVGLVHLTGYSASADPPVEPPVSGRPASTSSRG